MAFPATPSSRRSRRAAFRPSRSCWDGRIPSPERSEPLLLEKALASQVQTAVTVDESVQAPVEAGQRLGTMTATAGERLLAEIPLVAPEDVPARTFPELWAEFLKSICLSA